MIEVLGALGMLAFLVSSLVRATCIAWGAGESFLYYRAMKRQERLGLVEPIAVQRFWLWGVGLSAMTLLMATTFFPTEAYKRRMAARQQTAAA